MKLITILLTQMCFCSILFAQTNDSEPQKFDRTNSIQLELGGHGFLYSLNYEKVILNKQRFKTTAQAGIALYPASTGMRDLWLPVVINEMISFKNHHVELGLGAVFIREATRNLENNPSDWFWSQVLTGRVGYRYQKPDGRLIVRAGFTPFLEIFESRPIDVESDFHPFGGLAIGYAI